jgi:hypothetical protein
MPWQEELLALMRRGYLHERSATDALVLFARTRGTHIMLEQAVERLPPSCRGQARLILRDARTKGANDFGICQTVVTAYEAVMSDFTLLPASVSHD